MGSELTGARATLTGPVSSFTSSSPFTPKERLRMLRDCLKFTIGRMRAALLHIVTLIIASASIVGLAYATDPHPTRAPAVEAMRAAAEYSKSQTGHTMVVMFDGKVIFEQYDNGGAIEKPHYLASGQKCFIGPAAVAAVQDGLIKLDNPAVENIPEWKNDPEKSTITYRQLLSMTSGLTHPTGDDGKKMAWKKKIAMPMAAKPGERFEYGGYELAVFAYALEHKLASESFSQYLKRRILDPIGIKVPARSRAADGSPTVGPGNVTARDWATYGEFIRREGKWNDKQILDPALLRDCFKGSKANPAYGLTWWLKSPVSEELIRDADANVTKNWGKVANSNWLPDDLAAALGAGQQRLYIMPSLKLVIVRHGNANEGFSDLEFLRTFVPGLQKGSEHRE
jgi:CubicO group peptidase (beta-lactamase class C family)